ncbi:MAG: histidine phosphatase family protein [Pontiellaceae bacterium]|nr:histidine phosphatase family protein [Pontiellaceae bacterium]MBN2786510.1 histidine phosphatase family protein [Pontiellaceae bacterium]
MNLDTSSLRNTFFGFRHGESMANVEGIIISDPDNGIAAYGLSGKGRAQVKASARRNATLCENAVIISSDFLRATETAEIVREILGVSCVKHDPRLRERYFGAWEGACYRHYADAWEKDEINADLEQNGAESANAVRARMVDVVLGLDSLYCGRNIILVSHGDPLRFMQTAFDGLTSEENRTVPYFETAECRLMNP